MATKKGSTKAENDSKKEHAFLLFMQGVGQKEIAERVGTSQPTITDWKRKGNWEEKRAAKAISMDVLIGKALKKINDLLEEEDFSADAFAKAVAQLKNLKPSNTVDDEIMCLLSFQTFLLERKGVEQVDEAFIKKLTKLQDHYIQFRLGNGN